MDPELRQAVAQRAGNRCEYCRCPADFSSDDYAVEHILPRSRSGGDDPANLAWSCQGCNSRKFTATQASDPVTGSVVPLFHPRQDRWSDHFAWSEDATLLMGLTPKGRATVQRLQLNRPNVVNLRRGLAALGQHPPPG